MNNRFRTFFLTLLTVGGLVALGFLPEIIVGGRSLRRVDLFSDLKTEAPKDTPATVKPADKPKVDSTNETADHYQYFTDYTRDSTLRLTAFHKKMKRGAGLRIAYFGDSFIEGDILTADLRDLLHERLGGGGTGMYDVTSNVENARGTLLQRSEGFRSYASNGSGYDRAHSSINLHYSVPTGREAQVTFTKTEYTRAFRRHNSDTDEATLYFSTEVPIEVEARVGDSVAARFTFQPSPAIQTAKVEARWEKTFTWRVTTGGERRTWLYSAAFDKRGGAQLDGISLRGSSGAPIHDIDEAHMAQMARLRPYDLIFVGFGLNYASADRARTGYKNYKGDMKRVLQKLRRAYPGATLVLVSTSDRAERDEHGQMTTSPSIPRLVDVQRQIAQESHVAFLNLYEAMGGEGSIARMVDEGRARKDYTHITYEGGRWLAETIMRDLAPQAPQGGM